MRWQVHWYRETPSRYDFKYILIRQITARLRERHRLTPQLFETAYGQMTLHRLPDNLAARLSGTLAHLIEDRQQIVIQANRDRFSFHVLHSNTSVVIRQKF